MLRLFGDNARRLRLQFMSFAGRCDWLMGGTPSEVPDRYAQVSALEQVRADCPPTLLVHGLHDQMAPVAAVRELHRALDGAGARVAAVYLPHTDHMFDVIGTAWSPAAARRSTCSNASWPCSALATSLFRSTARRLEEGARAPQQDRADRGLGSLAA
jgi:acetyl esterase/lipase